MTVIRARVLPRFPASVVGGAGIKITPANGTYGIGVDIADLSEEVTITDPSAFYFMMLNTATGQLERVRMDNVIAGATGVDARTAIGDTAYSITITDRYVGLTAALTAIRAITLPAASSVPPGRQVILQDEVGGISAAAYHSIVTTGADTINGGSSWLQKTKFGGVVLRSNGSNAWNVLVVEGLSFVSDAAYAATFGDRVIAYRTLTAARIVTLPAAAAYPAGEPLTIVDFSGNCSGADTIGITRAGADTINGTTSQTLSQAYAFITLISDGVSKWTITKLSTITSAQISDATTVGKALITAASASAARTTLGSTTVGDAVFIAASAAVARSTLGSTTVGDAVFIAASAAAGRTALGAAASGSNSDITALTGLTTAIPISEGGTGQITAPAALAALGGIGQTALRGYLAGCILSNDATTPNTVVDISTGIAQSEDATTTMALATLTKSISSTWAVGTGNGALDQGAVLASTWYHAYVIERTDTGVVDALLSQAPSLAATVTATSASPAVFTWAGGQALPFQNGAPMVLSGTTAPTGFTLGTIYFVVASNQAAGTFELSATQGGSAINSTSTGTGLTATSAPKLPASYTKQRYIGSIKTDASSHILAFSQNGDEFLWAAAIADINTSTLGTSAVLFAMTVPPGFKTNVLFTGDFSNASTTQELLMTSPDQTDVAPLAVGGQLTAVNDVPGSAQGLGTISLRTNTAGQIRARATASSCTLACATYGYINLRGKAA